MSNCDCQKNIKKDPVGDGIPITAVNATIAKKSIGDLQLITTLVATTAGMIFGIRGIGVGQQDPLLIYALLVHWFSLLVFGSDY